MVRSLLSSSLLVNSRQGVLCCKHKGFIRCVIWEQPYIFIAAIAFSLQNFLPTDLRPYWTQKTLRMGQCAKKSVSQGTRSHYTMNRILYGQLGIKVGRGLYFGTFRDYQKMIMISHIFL
jgi:hypothetical protein